MPASGELTFLTAGMMARQLVNIKVYSGLTRLTKTLDQIAGLKLWTGGPAGLKLGYP